MRERFQEERGRGKGKREGEGVRHGGRGSREGGEREARREKEIFNHALAHYTSGRCWCWSENKIKTSVRFGGVMRVRGVVRDILRKMWMSSSSCIERC